MPLLLFVLFNDDDDGDVVDLLFVIDNNDDDSEDNADDEDDDDNVAFVATLADADEEVLDVDSKDVEMVEIDAPSSAEVVAV